MNRLMAVLLIILFCLSVCTGAATASIRPLEADDLKPRRESIGDRTLWVICVGASWMNGKPDTEHPCKYAAADARALAESLNEQVNAKPSYGKVETFVIVDEMVSQKAISDAFTTVIGTAQAKDTFLFLWSGLGDDECFPESDFETTGPTPTKYISGSQISQWILRIPARRVIAIFDTGDVGRFADRLADRLSSDPARRTLLIRSFGSSVESQEWGHGFIVHSLLSGLAGAADYSGGGLITACELATYLNSESQRLIRMDKVNALPACVRFIGQDFVVSNSLHNHTVEAQPTANIATRNVAAVAQPEQRRTRATADMKARKTYVMLVSSTNYEEFDQLPNAAKDTEAIEKLFQSQFVCEKPIFLRDPTREQVMQELSRLRTILAPEDQLLVFFAGHGLFDSNWNHAYLVFKDSKRADCGYSSYLSSGDILPFLDTMPARHVLLMVDACQGGKFRHDAHPQQLSNIKSNEQPQLWRNGDMYSAAPKEDLRDAFGGRITRKLICSVEDEDAPEGVPGKHSPFAASLIGALKTFDARDKFLSLDDLWSTVSKSKSAPLIVRFGHDEEKSDIYFDLKDDVLRRRIEPDPESFESERESR